MYEKDGDKYFVVDGHVHFWDASPENQANKYGRGFINCFYDFHRYLSPSEYVWPLEKFEKYSEGDVMHDEPLRVSCRLFGLSLGLLA